MNPVASSLVILACVFGSVLLGILVRRLLPSDHLSSDSKDVVMSGMGLVATTVALVLGLLVASAKNFYDTQTTEMTQFAANVVLLDRLLAHYGAEAAEARAVLRSSLILQVDQIWSTKTADQGYSLLATQGSESIVDKIQALSPKDDRQRSLQSEALNKAIQVGQTRLLVFEQKQAPVPKLLLVMLVFWLIAIFFSFGLFAPPNFTVLASLFVSAAAVSGAIFLILEMYSPYSGIIQVSDAPLRAALAQLGR
jgi:hypothetical protein